MHAAYVNGLREGVIHEKPLIMGDNGRNCSGDDDEMFSSSLLPLDLTDEMNIAIKSCISSTTHDSTKDLKRLGQERHAFKFTQIALLELLNKMSKLALK